MSLKWNLTKVAGFKPTGRLTPDCDDGTHDAPCRKCPKRPEVLAHDASGAPIPWAVTNGLIWATMAAQMGSIETSKDVAEFAVRVAIYQRMFGAWLVSYDEVKKGRKARPITTAEVLAHQGMMTNVSNRSRGQFLKALSEQLAREVEGEVRADILKVLKAAGAPAAAAQEAR